MMTLNLGIVINRRKFYASFRVLFFSLVWAVFPVYSNLSAQNTPTLSVTILDGETGNQTPVRIKLTDRQGRHTGLPDNAIEVMYGRDDTSEGYGFQPDSAFYADGEFSLRLQPDVYDLAITKGNEYLEQNHSLDLSKGSIDTTIVMQRWINMPERGWYSSDDHIHMRRSPRENPLLLRWIAAEDIHVGHLLQMGDYHATYYTQYAFGREGIYHEHGSGLHSHNILSPGQEDPRTHEIGHTISLAADSLVRSRSQYYYYDRLADKIHQLNGLFGYAHQGVTFHGYQGMTLDVFDGKVDFLEILQTCVDGGPLETENYYHFLNLGFPITATAGSDFPWCGYSRYAEEGEPQEWDAQIGNVRFYTYTGDDYSFENWKKGVTAGHTFVSNGPILDLKVNGRLPGSVIDINKGDEIEISVTAYGHEEQVPLESLQLISHGNILESIGSGESSGGPEELRLQKTMNVQKGIWIAAKVKAGPLQYAHSTPVYIRVNGGGFHDEESLQENLDKAESYLDELSDVLSTQDKTVADNEAWRYKERLSERINETRDKINDMRKLNQ
ncbi:MAG: CehA/McbA family metallohydrolase [Balneolaceae bacterium]